MPTFGSLFSGIGGLDLGLERAGWTPTWQVESDEWCRRVLERHWPSVPRWGAVESLTEVHPDGGGVGLEGVQPGGTAPRPVGRVDLVCGGFPCQSVSLAGRRLAQADDRWLWPEFARVVRVLRPRFVLVENVTGLLAGHGGMGDILGDLAACGYDAEWDCIPAAAVGAPHLRYRVFVVAYADGSGVRLQPAGLPGSGGASVAEHDGREGSVAVSDSEARNAAGRTAGAVQGIEVTGRSALEPGRRGGGPSVFGPTPDRVEWWATEPDVGRVAHGIPRRLDRLRGIGNAVVPQVAQWIGGRLMELAGAVSHATASQRTGAVPAVSSDVSTGTRESSPKGR